MATSESRGSGWSIRIGAALGIPIRVHFTFLLLLVWYTWYAWQEAGSGGEVGLAVLRLLLLFGSVLLHELGHAAAARQFQVRTREIVLYPIGGIARLENMPSGRAELLIALAGPAVNLVLAVLLVVSILLLNPGWLMLAPEPGQSGIGQLLVWLLFGNVLLCGFNLIPAFPMDGGRVLRALLSLTLSQQRATEIASAIGQGIAILFGIVAILTPFKMLLLIALFVFIGASQEAFFQRQRALVVGGTARNAMVSRFDVLAPQETLDRAARMLLETHQQDFPVIDAWGRLAGVLPRVLLLEGLARVGPDAAVLEVMDRDAPTVAPATSLDRVLQLLRARPQCPVIVLDDERPVGMITLETLTEFMEVARRRKPATQQA